MTSSQRAALPSLNMVEKGPVKTRNMDTYISYVDTIYLLVIKKFRMIAQKSTQATQFAVLDSPGTTADHFQLGGQTDKLAKSR